MSEETRKDRARKEVLWYICQFHLGVNFGKPAWTSIRPPTVPLIGSLVALQSMRERDFYLGWLVSVRPERGDFFYTVESLETGQVVEWSNVGIMACDPEAVRPEWRWTDDQWAFKDRWHKVCYDECEAYIVLPTMPDFDGNAVVLGTRIRHGMGENSQPKRFDEWSKVTDADMTAFYTACVADIDDALERKKRERAKS